MISESWFFWLIWPFTCLILMILTTTKYHENLLRDSLLYLLFMVKFFSSLETKMVLKISNKTFLRITRYLLTCPWERGNQLLKMTMLERPTWHFSVAVHEYSALKSQLVTFKWWQISHWPKTTRLRRKKMIFSDRNGFITWSYQEEAGLLSSPEGFSHEGCEACI